MTMIDVAPGSAEAAAADVARLVARHDGRVPRYTSYPTAPHFDPADRRGRLCAMAGELPAETPLSLYLHVPFCDRLCLYCGCNTSVVRLESSHRAYPILLMREIDHVRGTDRPARGRCRTCTGAAARRPRCPATA